MAIVLEAAVTTTRGTDRAELRYSACVSRPGSADPSRATCEPVRMAAAGARGRLGSGMIEIAGVRAYQHTGMILHDFAYRPSTKFLHGLCAESLPGLAGLVLKGD